MLKRPAAALEEVCVIASRAHGHSGELVAVVPLVDDRVGYDQMVLRIDGGLHAVANDARAATVRSHGSRIGIGQQELLVLRNRISQLMEVRDGHLLWRSPNRFPGVSRHPRCRRGGLLQAAKHHAQHPVDHVLDRQVSAWNVVEH